MKKRREIYCKICFFAFVLLYISSCYKSNIYYSRLNGRVWKNNTVKWYYNPSNQIFNTEKTVASVKAAAAAWEKVCGIKFVYMGTTEQKLTHTSDDKFIIGWLDDNRYKSRFGKSSSAHTHIWWTRYIDDGEMSLNADAWKNKNYDDFQGIMTHELGHLLGLAHSDNPDSIMYFPYRSAQYQMTPTKYDIDAVIKLYPK
jgi:predicted Zn-dependent protease